MMKKPSIQFSILSIFFLINVLMLVHWCYAGSTTIRSKHFLTALEFANAYSEGFAALWKITWQPANFPPFFFLISGFFLFIFGYSQTVYLVSSFVIFGSVATFSIYFIGKRLFSKNAGLFAGLFFLSFTLLQIQSRVGLLEIPLTAIICLTFLGAIWAYPFQSLQKTLVLALCLGIGLLVKQTFVLYIIGPMVTVAIASVLSKESRKSAFLNLAVLLITTFLIAITWYARHLIKHLTYIFDQTIRFENGSGKEIWMPAWTPETFSFDWAIFYLKKLSIESAPIIITVFFAIGLVTALINLKKKRSFHTLLILIWFFSAYILFTCIPLKQPRYLIPIFPSISLICAMPFAIEIRRSARVVISALSSMVILLVFVFHFVPLHDTFVGYQLFRTKNSLPVYPVKNRWPVKEIAQDIKANSQWPRPLFFFLNQQEEIFDAMRLECALAQIDIGFKGLSAVTESNENILPYLLRSDFVLYKTKSEKDLPHWTAIGEKTRLLLENPPQQFLDHFDVLKIYKDLPDHSKAILYKRSDGFFATGMPLKNGCNFDNKISLAKMEARQIQNLLLLSYYWKCLNEMDYNYKVFVHIRDGQTHKTLFQQDHEFIDQRIPTSQWKKGDAFKESYLVWIPDDVTAGSLEFRVGVFQETKNGAPVLAVVKDDECPNAEDFAVIGANITLNKQ